MTAIEPLAEVVDGIPQFVFPISDWQDCYADSWKGLIVPAAFSHPAKFAPGLIRRIIEHGLERGYWKPGDTIGDPFGGVALGGIACAYRGLNWIGCELEPRFVALAEQNFALHTDRLRMLGKPLPRIVQGDSRCFAEQIARTDMDGHGRTWTDAVVTSPPYADSVNSSRSGIDWDKAARPERWGKSETRNGCQADAKHQMKYGQSEGQIGALKSGGVDSVITSPPFSAPGMQPVIGQGTREQMEERGRGRITADNYGHTDGQIATLKPGSLQTVTVDGVVTSPPFMDSNLTTDKNFMAKVERDKRNGSRLQPDIGSYGETSGQIGNDKGETYWEAVAAVYRSMFQAMRAGGVAALVVKDYVSKGKRVTLCDDTLRLLNHCGFVTVERVRAMLVQSRTESDLFNGTTTKTKERKSFFRRLHEKKPGAVRIDWEEVLFVRKPLDADQSGGGADGIITSPPFETCEGTRDDNFRYKGKPLGTTGKHYGQTPGQIGNLKAK